jgi:hypothetical protein
MRRTPWATYLWPGLPEVWAGGSWLALIIAVVAAVLLNVALLASFGWNEWPEPMTRRGRTVLWVILAAGWVASAAVSVLAGRRRDQRDRDARQDGTFAEAIDYYLKADYFQAERILSALLGRNARDLDARLMRATLFRHTGRREEAARELDLMTRCEGAEKWELEIGHERELLAEAATGEPTEAGRGANSHPTEPPAEMQPAA